MPFKKFLAPPLIGSVKFGMEVSAGHFRLQERIQGRGSLSSDLTPSVTNNFFQVIRKGAEFGNFLKKTNPLRTIMDPPLDWRQLVEKLYPVKESHS